MEFIIILVGFVVLNIISNYLAYMSPLLSAVFYFTGIIVLFRFINSLRIKRVRQAQEDAYQRQNQQFKQWRQSSAEKSAQFDIRDDVIDAEYTEREIKDE